MRDALKHFLRLSNSTETEVKKRKKKERREKGPFRRNEQFERGRGITVARRKNTQSEHTDTQTLRHEENELLRMDE